MREPLRLLLDVEDEQLQNGVDCVLLYDQNHVDEIPEGVVHAQQYRVSIKRYITGEPPQRVLDRVFLGGAGWGEIIDNFQPQAGENLHLISRDGVNGAGLLIILFRIN
ncbi:hypothetical protein M5689_022701 [Euphorbia peplus]|nr:hypothetical protein M5689_022701 [Euphorbia peplus]